MKGRLMDVAAVKAELGVTRAAAERIFRSMPVKVTDPDVLRKTYIKRADLEAWLESNTVEDQVA